MMTSKAAGSNYHSDFTSSVQNQDIVQLKVKEAIEAKQKYKIKSISLSKIEDMIIII